MVLGFIELLIVLVIVVAAAWVFGRVWRRNRAPEVTLPSCGQCGYAVRGVASLTCPECGADLREVGIVTPQAIGAQRGLGLLAFVLLWTVLLPLLALFITSFILRAIPKQFVTQSRLSLTPHSGNYPAVHIDASISVASRPGGSVHQLVYNLDPTQSSTISFHPLMSGRQQTVTVTLEPKIQPGVISTHVSVAIDPSTLAFEYATPQGITRGPSFHPAAAEAFLVAGGIPATAPSLKDEAYELAASVTALCQGQNAFTFQHFSTGTTSNVIYVGSSALWVGRTALLFWLIVYAGGITLYVRAWRKRQRAGESIATSVPSA